MNIDFPLILTLAVFVTGIGVLVDYLVFAKPRKQAIALAESQFGEDDVLGEDQRAAKQLAVETAGREPTWAEYSKSFFPVLAAVFILRSFIVEPFQIPSKSMVPTLLVGDFILVNKFTYGIRLPVVRTKVLDLNEPKRGDVMVFFPPHEDRYFIKRVVGLPGDEIRYINNVLYVNGEKQPQTFVAGLPARDPYYQVMTENLDGVVHSMHKNIRPGKYSRNHYTVVPEGHYFMMGDNRDNSADSREWGPVPEENIVGKAFAIWMNWKSFTDMPSFSRVGSFN
ncbi:MAG: signal peptidase I [Cellvibrionaceae bacterium]